MSESQQKESATLGQVPQNQNADLVRSQEALELIRKGQANVLWLNFRNKIILDNAVVKMLTFNDKSTNDIINTNHRAIVLVER